MQDSVLSYGTKITFELRPLHKNVEIPPFVNATLLWTSFLNVKQHIQVICIFNPLVDYRF